MFTLLKKLYLLFIKEGVIILVFLIFIEKVIVMRIFSLIFNILYLY